MKYQILSLSLAVVLTAPGLPAQTTASDPEVAAGIRKVDEGDYDAAIVILDAATRRLSAGGSHARDLGDAFLYLGVAYLAKGHEISARARFREALAQVRDLKLNADKFAPKVIEIFEAARDEMRGAAPAPGASPAPAPRAPASPPPVSPPLARNKGGSKKGLLLVGAGVVVAGGVAAVAAGGGSEDASSYRLDPADSQQLPTHGGIGGSDFQSRCPADSVATGITGVVNGPGDYVARIAAGCAPLLSNGSTGAATVLTLAGSASPGTAFNDTCPAGQVVVSVFGSNTGGAFDVVQRIGVGCAPLAAWVSGGAGVTQLSAHGGPGGAAFSDTCVAGSVVVAITGSVGSYVDHLAATCVRVRR